MLPRVVSPFAAVLIAAQGDDSRRARGLAAYDRMTEAAGAECETRIFPPPGHWPWPQLS